jgi:hypothetical protein
VEVLGVVGEEPLEDVGTPRLAQGCVRFSVARSSGTSLTLGFLATVPCPAGSRSVFVGGQGHRRRRGKRGDVRKALSSGTTLDVAQILRRDP